MPVCFMVMPYGTKKTGAPTGQGFDEIDFDALWEMAFRPAIEALHYEAVRADQDIGALIIHEMLERLYFSDLVLADVTIPNGNVYYEIGIRHACRERGCILLAADWSKGLFDIAQMRSVRYPLSQAKVDSAAAEPIRAALAQALPARLNGVSPLHQTLPGYPDNANAQRAGVLRGELAALSAFQSRLSAARAAPEAARGALIAALTEDALAAPLQSSKLFAMVDLLKSIGAWQAVLDLVARVPEEIKAEPNIVECTNLARSKLGNHLDAIGALEALIRDVGATSEREGLLGGRYKKLYREAVGGDARLGARYLNESIKHYEQAMMLDLNDYYPSSNLPRLYRARAAFGDLEKAIRVATVVFYACERAKLRHSTDDWLRPTLLGAAFDAANVEAAATLATEIEQGNPASWRLETTLADLRESLNFVVDAERRAALAQIAERLAKLSS